MSDTGYQGALNEGQDLSEYGSIAFLVSQMLSRVNTATLVKVVSCTNAGGLSPVGFVDVQPLVNQLDGADKAIPHGKLYRLPYVRVQGGANAVIIDPEKDDIGLAVFASKDISAVKATKAQANPGSGRRFNMADGLYIGGLLNGTPQQYVQFDTSGITITSPNDVTVNCQNANINAAASAKIDSPATTVTGTLEVDGAVTMKDTLQVAQAATVGALASTGAAGASSVQGDMTVTGGDVTADGTSLKTHTHPDPQGGNTGAPN